MGQLAQLPASFYSTMSGGTLAELELPTTVALGGGAAVRGPTCPLGHMHIL